MKFVTFVPFVSLGVLFWASERKIAQKIPELWFPVPLVMCMKTNLKSNRWFNRKSSRSPAAAELLILLLVGGFGLLPTARALLPSPTPDGGYIGNNTAEGTNALFNLNGGIDKSAVGFRALYNHTIGNYNTAAGFRALFSNTSGTQNTATGVNALTSNTSGSDNPCNGFNALVHNTTGHDNTAIGADALFSNTAGIQNTANGAGALQANTTGNANTANGTNALQANTTSFGNTASGFVALLANTTGGGNTATGAGALQANNGAGNVASGFQALLHNTTGATNTALGYQAGMNQTTGSQNVYIGVGMAGHPGESNACYIASIWGQTPGFPSSPVYVDSEGKLGTNASSKRFKQRIKPMDQVSEAILALKPVTFHYKTDAKSTPQFGLIAEDVAEVNPDLVVRDKDGEIYSVRYEAVNAMLLNEFLKEHKRVQELNSTAAKQEAMIAQQRKDFAAAIIQQQNQIASLARTVKEQAAQIQKVSAQVQTTNPAPQMALNSQ